MTLKIISAILLVMFLGMAVQTYIDMRNNRSTPVVRLLVCFLSIFGGLLTLTYAL